MSKLLLQDAVILGETMKKCNPEEWLTPDGSCGCALGGAILAAGIPVDVFRKQFDEYPDSAFVTMAEIDCVKSRWPWLTWEHVWEISKLYFAVESGTKTIEDVAAYVRTIEPVEDPQLTPEEAATCDWRDEEGSDVNPAIERFQDQGVR